MNKITIWLPKIKAANNFWLTDKCKYCGIRSERCFSPSNGNMRAIIQTTAIIITHKLGAFWPPNPVYWIKTKAIFREWCELGYTYNHFYTEEYDFCPKLQVVVEERSLCQGIPKSSKGRRWYPIELLNLDILHKLFIIINLDYLFTCFHTLVLAYLVNYF